MSKTRAFSAVIAEHTAEGDPVILDYSQKPALCHSDAWDGKAFTIPKEGLYAFTVSFVRDSQEGDDGKFGSKDDTKIEILVGDITVASAWAGENSRSRQSASVTVVLPLTKDMVVRTRDYIAPDAEDKFRRFFNCVFSGYLVGKLK